MEYKFDAFISYRHAEVDSAVAKDILHWLEHFHVSKAIQKASEKRRSIASSATKKSSP